METITIDSKYIKIWFEDGIIYNTFKPIEVSFAIAKSMVNDRLKVSNGFAYPMFIDVSSIISMDLEARKYLAGEEAAQLVTAGVLFINNPIAKFAGNLFLRINKPRVPTRVSTNKKDAIEWLQQYKQHL